MTRAEITEAEIFAKRVLGARHENSEAGQLAKMVLELVREVANVKVELVKLTYEDHMGR